MQSTVRGVPRFLLLIDLRVRARFYIKGKKKKKEGKKRGTQVNWIERAARRKLLRENKTAKRELCTEKKIEKKEQNVAVFEKDNKCV